MRVGELLGCLVQHGSLLFTQRKQWAEGMIDHIVVRDRDVLLVFTVLDSVLPARQAARRTKANRAAKPLMSDGVTCWAALRFSYRVVLTVRACQQRRHRDDAVATALESG